MLGQVLGDQLLVLELGVTHDHNLVLRLQVLSQVAPLTSSNWASKLASTVESCFSNSA